MNSKQLWLYFAFLSVAIACRPVTEIETRQVPTPLSAPQDSTDCNPCTACPPD